MGSGFFSQDNPPPLEQGEAGPGPGNVVVQEPTGVDGATASFFGRGASPALQAFEEDAAAKAAEAAASAAAAANSAQAASASAGEALNVANALDDDVAAAQAAAAASQNSATASQGSATAASTSAGQAATSATQAANSATNALSSANSASTSATNSASSATNAASSASAAASSATSASGSATTATTKASEASASASQAASSATNAANSASAAGTSATNAATSATNASNSASAAGTSATNAAASATTATTKASEASTSATNAAASATSASGSASTATTKASEAAASATSAAGSASTATTKASEATTSATNAANSASAASTSATAAGTSATNAANSATAAAGSATAAGTSATNAANSASAAATSATNAANSASAAGTSATNAATSATSASTAQAAAESARDATLAAFDSFDDRYLGTKTSNPTVDNDGNALVAGALYFNSTAGEMRVYTGSSWTAAYVSGAGVLLIANNLSDVANAATARTNLGLGNVENKSSATIRSEITSGNVTTALGYTPYNATNPNGYISGITSGMVTTALGYTPVNKAGDTFTGGIVINNGSHQVILGSDGNIELTRSGGGSYIDFKDSTSDDFDARLQVSGNAMAIAAAGGLTLNGAGVLTGITSGMVTTALGYTPYNASNPNGYISGITSGNVTTALGYTPANKAGDTFTGSVHVRASGSAGYITLNSGNATYSGYVEFNSAAGNRQGYIGFSSTTATGTDQGTIPYVANTHSFTGLVQSNADVRAPLFYDHNDTSFYVNPNGETQLNTLKVRGETQFPGSMNGDWDGGYYHFSNVQDTPTGQWGHAEIIRLDTNWNVQTFWPTSNTNEVWTRRRNNGTYSTWRRYLIEDEWIGSKYFGSDGAIYGTIFMDANDGSYYCNPNGTSVLNHIQPNNIGVGTGVNTTWRIITNGANGIYLNGNGYGQAEGSWRAPNFYNSNDTISRWSGNDLVLRGASPTVFLRDTDHNSAMLHCNSNLFYILRGGNDTESWSTVGSGQWPLEINLTNNDAQFGGNVTAIYNMYAEIFYDRNDTGYYVNANGTSSFNVIQMAGLLIGRNCASTDVNAANDTGSYSVRGSTTTVAAMSFHRTGAFAINMGLGTDNVFRIGGWSASSNCFQMDSGGNLTMLGNVTAYSDARIKKDVETISGALDLVSAMRGVRYTRIDNDKRGVGVIAQEVLEVVPEVVQQGVGDDDTLSVAYGNLVGVLIEAIKELKSEVDNLKATVH